jgi:hypothetical protein
MNLTDLEKICSSQCNLLTFDRYNRWRHTDANALVRPGLVIPESKITKEEVHGIDGAFQ